jgi:hypothetical protein
VWAAADVARQALHAIEAWREALLLSAWQHQHNAAAAEDSPADPPASAALQQVLREADAAAAYLEHGDPSVLLTSKLSAFSLDPPQSSSSTQRHRVEFSSFWLPSE